MIICTFLGWWMMTKNINAGLLYIAINLGVYQCL